MVMTQAFLLAVSLVTVPRGGKGGESTNSTGCAAGEHPFHPPRALAKAQTINRLNASKVGCKIFGSLTGISELLA